MKDKKYSQFKALLAISKASLISITRSPSSVVFSIAFPLIFIIVFGFISGGRINLDVALLPGSDVNNPVYAQLTRIPGVHFTTPAEKEASMELSKGTLDAAIRILKKDHDGKPYYQVDLLSSGASPEKAGFFKLLLNQVVDKQIIAMQKISTPLAEIRETVVKGREYKMIDFILPGQLGFSILSSGVFGTAFVFISLRQTLVIKRFFATPVNRSMIVLGEALSRLVFSLIGSFIIIIIGHFAFGFTLIHGFVTVINMLILSILGLIVFMGFGFLVSGIAKNESAVPPIANIITLPQFLLSGTFFSINNFPSWLQPVSKALPLTYLNDALRKVAFEGASLPDVAYQIGIIFVWGVLVYTAAVKFFKWE